VPNSEPEEEAVVERKDRGSLKCSSNRGGHKDDGPRSEVSRSVKSSGEH